MFHYLIFIIRISLKKFKFFTLSPEHKAKILIKNSLFFEAGLIYKKLKNYKRALSCFKKVHATRQMVYCYEKLGLTSQAIELCDTHQLYQIGVKLCLKHQFLKKTAYFYSYYDIPMAIKYYKKLQLHYELGICYLKQYRFYMAYDTILKCQDPQQRLEGITLLKECALTLYLTKNYEDAFDLFVHMQDYLSALECAKKLNNTELIKEVSLLLTTFYVKDNDYLAAAYYIHDYNLTQSELYHALATTKLSTVGSAYAHNHLFHALHICFTENDLSLATKLSQVWLQTPSETSVAA